MANHPTPHNSGSELKLNKKLYNKSAYLNTINTQFTELVPPPPPVVEPVSTGEFFALYNDLFYEIPKEGEVNSHQFLIKSSVEYVGSQSTSNDIQALLNEITTLREENLVLQQSIVDLTLPTNDNTNATS
tara:strand:- start:5482 stop:5871 length:390 start_codon:yes stop_codon:yes gene_type:complete